MTGAWLALAVALAGGVGTALRHVVDRAVPDRLRAAYPWGLTLVNLTGSLALGVIAGLALGDPAHSVLATGLLGGYTTFSSASLDTAKLLAAGKVGRALGNGLGMLAAAVGCALLGMGVGAALIG